MSTFELPPTGIDLGTEGDPSPVAPPIADLRRAAEDGRKARAEAENLRRENAFLKAGVNLESPIGQGLLKYFDGELSVDKIREAAEPLGALAGVAPKAPEQPAADALTPAEQAAHNRISGAAHGGQPSASVTGDENPYDKAIRQHQRDLEEGMSRDRAGAKAMRTVIEAGLANDKRVMTKGE